MGRAVLNLMRANFLKWNGANANKLGGPRTNLGAQFMRSTNLLILADGFVVSVNHVAARQRYEGGTIRPQRSKLLTIPAIPEAYGKRAREFNNLRFAVLNGQPALIEADATKVGFGKRGVKNKGSVGGKVFYWLAKSVTQTGDKSLLPSEQGMTDVAVQAADSFMQRQEQRGQA